MTVYGAVFDEVELTERLGEVGSLVGMPDLWDDQKRAQRLLKEQKDIESTLASINRPVRAMEDALTAIELGDDLDDLEMLAEADKELEAAATGIEALELRRMLGDPADANNALIAISAGAGGTESLDWAGMLLRMYLRYCTSKGWKTRILDETEGDEAGIKNATVQVTGEYAYGMLKAETGVHRLVRISPFDAAARRHTSFAAVKVSPEVDDTIDIEINDADLKIDTYRAGGAGGQHVNKTDSAVRITHLPSGIVVQCQNERSQMKNRSTAMKILKSRMYEAELNRRKDAADAVHAEQKEISFGSQIRNYVLQPYRLVKDVRTGFEVGNADAVLDGDLDGLIQAFLMKED
ncbi:MAG: peptide chain release factor 2 [Myxococcota bacterium]